MTPYTPPEPYATLHHDDGYFTTTKREHDLRYSGPVRTKAFTESQLHSEVERVRRETVEECAMKMESQHTWLTNAAAANIIRSLK